MERLSLLNTLTTLVKFPPDPVESIQTFETPSSFVTVAKSLKLSVNGSYPFRMFEISRLVVVSSLLFTITVFVVSLLTVTVEFDVDDESDVEVDELLDVDVLELSDVEDDELLELDDELLEELDEDELLLELDDDPPPV